MVYSAGELVGKLIMPSVMFGQRIVEANVPWVVAIASIVFISTDIDDLLLLLALFADPVLDWRAIVMGQFVGIALLLMTSTLIALSAVHVSREHAALLGVAPLAFGSWRLWELWRSRYRQRAEVGASRARPVARRAALLQVITVTVLTIANGGDNIIAYVPLFAAAPQRIPVYAAVFAMLTAVWCVLAYLCVNNRFVYAQAHRFGHAVLPVAMVLLGLWSLWGIKSPVR
jgi:cadmium resistance protein CadD (predicted permease)